MWPVKTDAAIIPKCSLLDTGITETKAKAAMARNDVLTK